MGNNAPKTWINYLQMISDIAILNTVMALAFTLRDDWVYFFAYSYLYVGVLVVLSFLVLILHNFYGLYNTSNKDWTDIFTAVIVSLMFVSLVIIVISYAIPFYVFPSGLLLTFALLYAPISVICRGILLAVERKVTPAKRVIILANDNEIDELIGKLNGHDNLIGVVTDSLPEARPYSILGTFNDAAGVFKDYLPEVVLISGSVPEEVKSRVVLLGLEYGCTIYVVPNLYEIMMAQAVLDQFKDTPVFQIHLGRNPGKRQIKRVLDCLVAVFILLVTLPVTIAAAAAIKLTSPGPVFYTQVRVGRRNKEFMLYKFRTMVNNAEAVTGPVLSSGKDARVTKVGRILRTTRLDELPQLINVFKGDMSIVGPRPERPIFVEKYKNEVPGYTYRHIMDSGITGLAQISGKYSTSSQDKLRYDLLYAKGASPLFDLRIMLQTIKVMLQRDKAS